MCKVSKKVLIFAILSVSEVSKNTDSANNAHLQYNENLHKTLDTSVSAKPQYDKQTHPLNPLRKGGEIMSLRADLSKSAWQSILKVEKFSAEVTPSCF